MPMTASAQPLSSSAYEVLCLSESPKVWVIRNFLSDDVCDHMVRLAQGKLCRSEGFDYETGENAVVEVRTSFHCFLTARQDKVIASVEDKIADFTHIPAENGEAFQILRYGIGQEYKPHYDYFDPAFPGSAKVLERGGQRVATMIIYLSDVEEGGETAFPKRHIQVKPRKGTALFFTNVHPDGSLNPDSLHASLPVVSGTKWAATKWLRAGRFY